MRFSGLRLAYFLFHVQGLHQVGQLGPGFILYEDSLFAAELFFVPLDLTRIEDLSETLCRRLILDVLNKSVHVLLTLFHVAEVRQVEGGYEYAVIVPAFRIYTVA